MQSNTVNRSDVKATQQHITIPTRLLFTRRESATMLAISLRKLDQYTASGELKVRRIGGNVLIHFETLAAFASTDHGIPA